MSDSTPQLEVYRMAICLYPQVALTDFQGPLELLGSFSTTNRKISGGQFKNLPNLAINPEFISDTLDPVVPLVGPSVTPTMTYEEAMKVNFDIVFVPGGLNPPKAASPSTLEFIKHKGPEAKYLLAVCTGSWLVAYTGLLTGKRATTNKASYKMIVEDTKKFNINWVPKARWVVDDDNHLWTSSGITAGFDLAYAFLKYLAGEKFAQEVRALAEVNTVENPDDDNFAEYFGLA
ncbi:hypothetical protein V5O48_018772 [Marasmius crinis-equi]|uniref:DJ-1/PfpI domain-containing protein n=1 Tax=Marasmius crinis-equi TaxID=585013 RepID=A0ABR3EK92_9AGAR